MNTFVFSPVTQPTASLTSTSHLSNLQILVVIAAVLGIVIYRVITVSTLAALAWAPIRNNSQVATTATAVCINFCVIMLLNVVSACRGPVGSDSCGEMTAETLLE